MKTPIRIAAAILVLAVTVILGAVAMADVDEWVALAPERAVTALPGVGAGWLDTLRRVAGDARVEEVNAAMTATEGKYLLGVTEPWHQIISINTDMRAYAVFIRDSKAWGEGYGYQHPLALCNPAGVTAHEFGHRWRETLWPHGEVREGGDTLPTWAQGGEEEFADRFGRAMMALRGWDDPDPKDAVLNHRVRYLLIKSYWEE